MSSKITISSPHYRVVLGDPEDPETWTELDVQSITPDLTAAEKLWLLRHWGKMVDSPVKLMAVSAYYALKRTGQIEGEWEAFESAYIEISPIGDDAVDPTPPGADPD